MVQFSSNSVQFSSNPVRNGSRTEPWHHYLAHLNKPLDPDLIFDEQRLATIERNSLRALGLLGGAMEDPTSREEDDTESLTCTVIGGVLTMSLSRPRRPSSHLKRSIGPSQGHPPTKRLRVSPQSIVSQPMIYKAITTRSARLASRFDFLDHLLPSRFHSHLVCTTIYDLDPLPIGLHIRLVMSAPAPERAPSPVIFDDEVESTPEPGDAALPDLQSIAAEVDPSVYAILKAYMLKKEPSFSFLDEPWADSRLLWVPVGSGFHKHFQLMRKCTTGDDGCAQRERVIITLVGRLGEDSKLGPEGTNIDKFDALTQMHVQSQRMLFAVEAFNTEDERINMWADFDQERLAALVKHFLKTMDPDKLPGMRDTGSNIVPYTRNPRTGPSHIPVVTPQFLFDLKTDWLFVQTSSKKTLAIRDGAATADLNRGTLAEYSDPQGKYSDIKLDRAYGCSCLTILARGPV
ncbi:hypothetical protein SISNIDRAFT_471737 [Sistotremastrum niveocremeum HHB9708]|uniref:Uncharacterized protein n=1 Tax=Sistotremastrum niveocremeum HHB9708 TaxID=1314777 RepID=A0A164M9R5_9AGAM|nr:hypothetical protein SISNIDRAFT_471737 [Sistotremastrum niveocremeum HHB9708]